MKQKVGGAKEQGEMVAIAEVVSRCEALPLGRTEGEEVKQWVSRVLGGQETGTKEKVGGEEYGAGSGTSVSEAVGLAHSNGADAVSLLVQRVIADAEREVAMETVARGEAEEETMETDNVFHSVTSSALPSETTCSESTQPGSGSGMPHIATSLPQIVVGSAQPNSTEAVSAAALGEQGGMAASRLFSVSSFGSIGSISSETSSEPPPPSPEDLLERCLWGVAVCAVRCPAYYKPLYRLATTLHGLGHSQASSSWHWKYPPVTYLLCCSGCTATVARAPPRGSAACSGQAAAALCAQSQRIRCESAPAINRSHTPSLSLSAELLADPSGGDQQVIHLIHSVPCRMASHT